MAVLLSGSKSLVIRPLSSCISCHHAIIIVVLFFTNFCDYFHADSLVCTHEGFPRKFRAKLCSIGVSQGVAMNSLKFHPGPPCPTLLCPVSRPPLKWLYGCFKGGPCTDCGRLLPLGTPHAVRLCCSPRTQLRK
jgi:hypothetical protein